MKIAVVKYPGSHGAEDVLSAYSAILGREAYLVWHLEESLKKPDAVIIPGGFSFGDYLRPGSLSKVSPISGAVKKFAQDGGPVLGIGNGFQILCEMGILPGALLPNKQGSFFSGDVYLYVENTKTAFLKDRTRGEILQLPLASYCGCYFADRRTLKGLEDKGQIAFRYCTKDGDLDVPDNVNGSFLGIAGVVNRNENVLGLMAHPERAVEESFGGVCGKLILEGVFAS